MLGLEAYDDDSDAHTEESGSGKDAKNAEDKKRSYVSDDRKDSKRLKKKQKKAKKAKKAKDKVRILLPPPPSTLFTDETSRQGNKDSQ